MNATTKIRKVTISRPNFQTATLGIVGLDPLVLHKFSQKVQDSIRATQEAGSQSTKGKKREARVFEDNFEAARHRALSDNRGNILKERWDGFPASAVRNMMISACRTVGFKMTLAKLSLFCVADGYDEQGTGLVRIIAPPPVMDVRPGRNANGGIDLRARPMFAPGWKANITLRWDADQFSAEDVGNLLARGGAQVGIGEGRADSRMSAGCGWGGFELQE